MKTITVFCITAFLMAACGKSNLPRTHKKQKTPSHMIMTQAEKRDVNYDARENQKVIEENLKNKDKNMKHAEKQRRKQNEELNKLNQHSSKVKKVKTTAFTFY